MQKRNKIKQLLNIIEIARRNNQPHVTIDTQVALEAVHELNSLLLDADRTPEPVRIESEVNDGGEF
jgi:hypothetical protein